jgi:CRISPR-associated protein Cmr2
VASGFVDGCTTWFAVNAIQASEYDARLKAEQDESAKKGLNQKKREHERAKNEARRCYIERAPTGALQLPPALQLDPWPPTWIHSNWLALQADFELLTPWYSKDDRVFHVLDNPVRRDRVFGVPFMSAASWKGLLRWSFGMTTGLIGPAPLKDEKKRQQAEAEILHLFGNEKGASDDFQRGALAFYPTWFPRVSFEVINPHSRKTRAGTQPIYYEVVPPRTQGTLRLLYAPLPEQTTRDPGQATRDYVDPEHAVGKLLDAIEKLLMVYGFSAKRTAGWGLATVDEWVVRNGKTSHSGTLDAVKSRLGELLGRREATP